MPTTIQLPPQIADIREQYLRAYRQALAEHRTRVPELSAEVLVLVAGTEEYPEHHRLLRPDAIWRGADGQPAVAHVEAPANAAFQPVQVDANGVQVMIYSLPWDDCPLSFSHPAFAWPEFVDWLTLWIDRHGQFPADEHGLHGVIHSVSPPETRGNRHYLHIDFGSAPVSALAELIELLTKRGATRIAFGQPSST